MDHHVGPDGDRRNLQWPRSGSSGARDGEDPKPPAGARDDSGLLERDGELELIGSMVARARAGEGALVVVAGAARLHEGQLVKVLGAETPRASSSTVAASTKGAAR